MRVKLCGLRRCEDVALINQVHPDYAGFILAGGFKRTIDHGRMQQLKSMLDPSIPAVGVFVHETPDEIIQCVKDGLIDIIQLHGSGDDEEIVYLRNETGKQIIRAFKINSFEDVCMAEKSAADIIILDGGSGQGKAFDWSYLGHISRPYFLAGGITPQNVAEAIRKLHPSGIDVSSGVETDGVKDETKVRMLMKEIRND